MNILIDYDNVETIERQRGLLNVVQTTLNKLPVTLLSHGAAVTIRLYGGWYKEDRLSPNAQKLSAEIAQDFPAVISLGVRGTSRQVRASVDLARSLTIDPSRDLLNTYRLRSVPPNLQPKEFPFEGCVQREACPLTGTHSLLKNGVCLKESCSVKIVDVMTRPEQKLVDTMLTADLIHAASLGPSDLVVVTNDDDLWPGIRTAVHLGVTVHHIHPRRGRTTPELYASTVTKNYSQYSF